MMDVWWGIILACVCAVIVIMWILHQRLSK